MTTLREAAQQALEALEAIEPHSDSIMCYASTIAEWPANAIPAQLRHAIAALRAALAEQAQPVAWMIWLHGPVEIIEHKQFAELELERLDKVYPNPARKLLPLYTTPPAPVVPQPLTDEEILSAVGWERAEMYMKLTPNFPVEEARKETLKNARAVEAEVLKRVGVGN